MSLFAVGSFFTFLALTQASASQSGPRDILFKLAAHMPNAVCYSSSQSFVDILLGGLGAGPSSSHTTHISSSLVSVSDSGRYKEAALSNSPTWGEPMACLFGRHPHETCCFHPQLGFAISWVYSTLRAASQLDRLCGVPTIASSPNTTMLSRAPPSSLSLYLLERTG